MMIAEKVVRISQSPRPPGPFLRNSALARHAVASLTQRQAPLAQRPVLSPLEWKQLAGDLGLARRQQQIAYLILEGHGDKQIAAILQISLPTVRTHVGRLLQKLNVRNRYEIILTLFLKFWNTQYAGSSTNGAGLKSSGAPRQVAGV